MQVGFHVGLWHGQIELIATGRGRGLAKPSNAQRKSYERATDRCEQKCVRRQGSEHRSLAAICRVEVARKHARRYAKAKMK